MDLHAGDCLAHYRLLEQVGEGGMGVVTSTAVVDYWLVVAGGRLN